MNPNDGAGAERQDVAGGEPEVVIPELMKCDDITRDRQFQAIRIVMKHMGVTAVAGLVPLAYLDVFLISTSQFLMVKEISDVYRIPFRNDLVKAYLATLVGGLLPMSVARGLATRVFSKIPVLGPVMNVMTYPWLASAATYAVGKIFIHHYELGGTLLSFKPESTRAYLEELYREGRLVTRRYSEAKRAFFASS